MACVVDSNVLVYRVDSRFPDKKRRALEFVRSRVADGSLRLPHQAIVEFVSVATRPMRKDPPLLSFPDAVLEAESLMAQCRMLWPEEGIVRLALRGKLAYQLPWYDAHMWAYAEFHRIEELASEDFQHGRIYGTVRAFDPFR